MQGWKLTLAVGAAFAALAPPASAATFTPDTFDDDDPEVPAHCVAPAAGETCSLREAVAATHVSPENDEVVLSVGTYELDTAGRGSIFVSPGSDEEPAGSLLIRGAGQAKTTVNGNAGAEAGERIFEFDRETVAELRDLGVTGGFATGADNGGAIEVLDGNEAGEDGQVTLTRVWLFGNSTENDGGAISNSGKLTLNQSLVSDNTAGHSGGGIENDDELTLINTTISGNRALGIDDNPPTLSTQAEDQAGNGGGIDNDGDEFEKTENPGVYADHSTIADNTANGNGGGVSTAIDEENEEEETELLRSRLVEGEPRALAYFSNSVVSDNSADAESNCSGNFPPSNGILSSSQGHNIEDGTSCEFTATGDLDDTPELGPLADNGGGTRTHALSTTSPALGAAADADCPATDQRGVARPQGDDGCDMGAFEREPVPPSKEEEEEKPPVTPGNPQQPGQPQQPGTPRGQQCIDGVPPITRLGRRNVRVRSRSVRLRGRSRDAAGECPSGVQRVEVSLARVSGTGLNCRFLRRSTRFVITPFRNCRRPVLFRARGTTSWRFTFRTALPPGKYRVQARAYDNARNKETPKKRRNIVFFTVE